MLKNFKDRNVDKLRFEYFSVVFIGSGFFLSVIVISVMLWLDVTVGKLFLLLKSGLISITFLRNVYS